MNLRMGEKQPSIRRVLIRPGEGLACSQDTVNGATYDWMQCTYDWMQ